jgi:hypothetical protein
MGVVGAFPGINDWKRRTIRGPISEFDKSTIVSICPKELNDRKCTVFPGHFVVHAGSFDAPSILVVGPSSWWRDIDEDQPLLEIPVSSIQIAESVVRDWCNGILGCNMSDHMPGYFFIPGEHTVKEIKEKYKTQLERSDANQKNWYRLLVKMGDSLWARSSGNPLAISDDMRLAAKELGIQHLKDWMKDFAMVDMVRCKACGSLKNPLYPICATCHFPDPDHPMTAKLLDLKKQLPVAGT